MLICLLSLLLLAGSGFTLAGALPKLQQELVPKTEESFNGFSVAINSAGTRAVLGAPSELLGVGDGNTNSSVTVFDRFGSTWAQTAVFQRTQPSSFGNSVDISADGNTIVIGDPNHQGEYGAVFIYENVGNSWDAGTPLVFPEAFLFGFTVRIAADGNTLATVAFAGTDGSVVIIYARIESAWILQGLLYNPNNFNIAAVETYEEVLAISGDGSEMVVGYSGDPDISGSIGYYKRNSSLLWSMSGPYVFVDGTELLGGSLAMTRDASYVVSGAVGGAYVFKKSLSGETYDLLQAFSVPIAAYSVIPSSVAIQPTNGKQIFIGSAFIFNETGAVYMYSLQGGSFVPVPGYISSGTTNATAFGYRVDLSDDGTLLVGAPLTGDDYGAAFVFASRSGCRPSNGLNQLQCVQRSLACSNSLKWTGKGCRIKKKPQGDGGCQCRGYCGYKCRGACNSDKECTWKTAQKACYVKATQQRGGPITSC